MGLKIVPAVFIDTMNILFVDMLDKGVVVFLHDVLKYSVMVVEHFKLLEKVFACLCKHAFCGNLKKCRFL